MSTEYLRSKAFCEFVTSALHQHTDLPINMDNIAITGEIVDDRCVVIKTTYHHRDDDTQVTLPDRTVITLKTGDTIRLYVSRKYAPAALHGELRALGLGVKGPPTRPGRSRRKPYRFGLQLMLLTKDLETISPRSAARDLFRTADEPCSPQWLEVAPLPRFSDAAPDHRRGHGGSLARGVRDQRDLVRPVDRHRTGWSRSSAYSGFWPVSPAWSLSAGRPPGRPGTRPWTPSAIELRANYDLLASAAFGDDPDQPLRRQVFPRLHLSAVDAAFASGSLSSTPRRGADRRAARLAQPGRPVQLPAGPGRDPGLHGRVGVGAP